MKNNLMCWYKEPIDYKYSFFEKMKKSKSAIKYLCKLKSNFFGQETEAEIFSSMRLDFTLEKVFVISPQNFPKSLARLCYSK